VLNILVLNPVPNIGIKSENKNVVKRAVLPRFQLSSPYQSSGSDEYTNIRESEHPLMLGSGPI